MGQAMKRRMRDQEPESIIPKDIQEVFDEVDIEKTWDYLEKTFHLNKTKWKGLFEEQYGKSSRQYNKVELFVRFGKEHLEEPICKIIYRDPFYSRTWMALIRFIVKHKIAEKEKEAAADKAKYGVSSNVPSTSTRSSRKCITTFGKTVTRIKV